MKSLHSTKTQNRCKNIKRKLSQTPGSRSSKQKSKFKKLRKQTLFHLRSDERTDRDEELWTTEVIGVELPISLQVIGMKNCGQQRLSEVNCQSACR
ncbi:hypothetical protein OIU79_022388 [Salix purpurea]|uniref:Uncharacterized protein n=1 Tax=Salix purpurea TaxID=77065 RepID=A0A9Q0WG84_SALPP|nr:hypothetical protein OIU79_022388 [Salix purpurea]